MKEPILYRKDIPFYHDKTADEYRQDSYENYDSVVTRQVMIHLSDDLWKAYPMQKVLDYVIDHKPSSCNNLLEIGCGVGRVIGEIAMRMPKSNCWGIDYSYQMLKKAKESWIDGESIKVNLSRYGIDDVCYTGKKLENLQFGLAKCENLPFENESQDYIFSAFLFDRLADPIKGLQEMKRILHPSGKIVVITPLNFVHSSQWARFYPPIKIWKVLQDLNFNILDWNEDMILEEPMDKRGNVIRWNCIGYVCNLK